MESDYMKISEIAKRLDVHESTVWRWVSDKTLPAIKVGNSWRVARVDFSNFIKSDTDTDAE